MEVHLLIFVIIILVGGIFISKTIFTGFHSENQGLWKVLHIGVSNIALILIGIHVGLNFTWIKAMTKKLFKITEPKKYTHIIANVAVCIIFLFGVYNIYSKGFVEKTFMVFKAGQMQAVGEGHHQINMGEGRGKGGIKDFEGTKKPPTEENFTDEERRNFEGKMKGKEGFEKDGNIKGKGAKTSPISVVIDYMSILAVFSIVTYKLCNIKKPFLKLNN